MRKCRVVPMFPGLHAVPQARAAIDSVCKRKCAPAVRYKWRRPLVQISLPPLSHSGSNSYAYLCPAFKPNIDCTHPSGRNILVLRTKARLVVTRLFHGPVPACVARLTRIVRPVARDCVDYRKLHYPKSPKNREKRSPRWSAAIFTIKFAPVLSLQTGFPRPRFPSQDCSFSARQSEAKLFAA